MKHDTETYSFSAEIKARTAKALLVLDHATGEELWLPLSHVLEIHGDPMASLVVSVWIAKKKGLI